MAVGVKGGNKVAAGRVAVGGGVKSCTTAEVAVFVAGTMIFVLNATGVKSVVAVIIGNGGDCPPINPGVGQNSPALILIALSSGARSA